MTFIDLDAHVELIGLDPEYGGMFFLIDTGNARMSADWYRTEAAATADWKAGTVAWKPIQ